MGLGNWIKGVAHHMINGSYTLEDCQKIFGIDKQMSLTMMQNIGLWLDMYRNEPPWFENADATTGKFGSKLLNFPAILAKDIGKKAVSEFYIKATIAGQTMDDGKTPKQEESATNWLSNAISPQIRRQVEYAVAIGGVLARPYWDLTENRLQIGWYTADNVIPLSWEGNTLTGVILIDTITKQDEGLQVTRYTKLECHKPIITYDKAGTPHKGYLIISKAFRNTDGSVQNGHGYKVLGSEIPLTAVPAWENIDPEVTINNVELPLFSYMGTPWSNNIDMNSPLGASIFKDAIDTIEQLDSAYTSFCWEGKAGEAKVFMSDSIVPKKLIGGKLVDNRDPLSKKLIVSVDTTQEELIKEYSPVLRIDQYVTSIKQNLAMICLQCQLDPSAFVWDAKTGAITATEVVSKQQTTYETIVDVQEKMVRPAINTLILACKNMFALYAKGNDNPFTVDSLEFSIDFGDSILIDEQTERNSAQAECTQGLRSKLSYLTEYRGMTEEEALKEIELIKSEAPTYEPYNFGA